MNTLLSASVIAPISLLFCLTAHAQTLTWVTESSAGFHHGSWLTSAAVNGKIYVIGGRGINNSYDTLEIFNPDSNSWSSPQTTGTFIQREALSSAVVNGNIYLIGGDNDSGFLNTIQIYNTVTNSWETPVTAGTFTPRGYCTAAVVNNKIYVIGGWNGEKIINTMEVFDPDANSWSTLATSGTFTPRYGLTSCVINGKIYVIGGTKDDAIGLNTLEIFDPDSDSWSTPVTTGFFTPRFGLASAVGNGKIYTIGGVIGDTLNNDYTYLHTVEIFDPASNSWSTPVFQGSFTPRAWFASASVDSVIYAMGGRNDSGYLNVNEALTGIPTPVVEDNNSLPITVQLSSYPNPTSFQTTISFTLPSGADVNIKIYDALGRIVSSLGADEMSAGTHSMQWQPGACPTGSYVCELISKRLGVREHCALVVMR